MVIDELHAAAKAGSGAAAMAPSPPGRSAGSRRIGARVSKHTLGWGWPLDLSPFRWFTATVDQSLRWGMAVLPRGVSSESRRDGVRSRNSLHSDVRGGGSRNRLLFLFRVDWGPVARRGEGTGRIRKADTPPVFREREKRLLDGSRFSCGHYLIPRERGRGQMSGHTCSPGSCSCGESGSGKPRPQPRKGV